MLTLTFWVYKLDKDIYFDSKYIWKKKFIKLWFLSEMIIVSYN
jgi:hypothetical protein